ncbi:MAG: SAM-dependent methyltransferase [Firmicutes bacterium]|nr:SAM-dependent methyltransferase [Bacillota bacterium]
MNSERIQALARNITEKDTVVDIGCDHGYLSIFLKQNNICKKVYASDISEQALSYARKNIKKYNMNIETFISDGFNNIPVYFDTAVIAGMGTSTILKIISHKNTPNKLVLASNNEYYRLRKSLNKMGYKIVDEQAILENNHYYIILLCIKGKQQLNKIDLKFGISNNDAYYKYLLNKNKELMKKVPFTKRIKLYFDCLILKKLIERK